MSLQLYINLPPGARFRVEGETLPHYIKVNDQIADVCPSHKLYHKSPKAGFFHPDPGLSVMSFDDVPLHERFDRGWTDNHSAMLELARTFPSIAGFYPPAARWDAEALDRAALKFSSREIAVARFLLALWNPGTQWNCGRFHLVDAASSMDPEDRRALSAWLLNPWWP